MMKTISVAYKLKALHRIARQGRIWGEEMSRSNQEQRKILAFARRHGEAAACDAYEVSRWTLRRWRKLARTRGEAFLGDCRGGRSGRRSGRKADRRQVEFICAFRADRLHLNAGKQAVKPALDAFSRECGLPPLSVSTIGRLIADAPDGMRASPRMDLDRRGRVKPRKRCRNHERRLPKRMSVRNPGDLVALDTVEIRPVGGVSRLFLFTAVDHHSRLAFAMAFPKRNAQCAAEFLRRLLLVLPVPVLALLSDNGAEFQADFDRLADRLGLRRFFIFPSCPKQNGRNERFNRTLRYGFVQANEHFADDLHAFNRQLAAWLIWYNAQKPHRALAGNTPLNFLHSHPKNGQLLWTPTTTAETAKIAPFTPPKNRPAAARKRGTPMKNPLQSIPVVRLALVALACVVPIAVAQTQNAISAGGENCLKVECESGQITNACGQPVNFARCHAADDKGCLLLPVGRIQSSETLPFACALGKLVRVSGCFPPFIPASVSGTDHTCLPDPKDPAALAASAGRPAQVPQIPATATATAAPATVAVAAAVAEAEADEMPELTEAEIRVQEQESEAAMQKAWDIALQASEANALSEESAAELRRLREKYDDGGRFLETTGQLLHGMAILGAGYMASQGKIKEAKSMLEAILKVKGTIDENTRQQAENLLAQIEEAEAQQQQQGNAEALTAQSMEALRGAPPPTGTETEKLLRTNDAAWGGQLDVDARVLSGNFSHLHVAARENDMEAARWLLANGADVNAKSKDSYTILHWAVFFNAAEVAKLLIANGAEVNAKGTDGKFSGYTPLDLAIYKEYGAMQSLLHQHGGRCNTRC